MARARQAAGDEPHVAAEVVGRAQVDEALLDRGLAEEHRGRRAVTRDRLHARHDEPIQPSEVVRRSAPRNGHLAVSRRKPGGRLCQCAVLHHEPAGQYRREHGGTCDHPGGHEQQSLAADAEACCDQSQGEPEPAKRLEHQYSESTGV